MFPELCFAAKLCRFVFPVAESTFLPRWNSEEGKLHAGITKPRVGNELLGEPVTLKTINELKMSLTGIQVPSPVRGAGKFWELLLSSPFPSTVGFKTHLSQVLGVCPPRWRTWIWWGLSQNVPNSRMRSPKSPPSSTCTVPCALAVLGEGAESRAWR